MTKQEFSIMMVVSVQFNQFLEAQTIMALTTLQKTLKAEEFQEILNRNPRLMKFHKEIQAQNAKIDAMINRITTALEKGDDKAAFSEFPIGQAILAASKIEQPKTEAQKSIISKIRPFNS